MEFAGGELLATLLTFGVPCCCCLILLGGAGGGAYYFMRRRGPADTGAPTIIAGRPIRSEPVSPAAPTVVGRPPADAWSAPAEPASAPAPEIPAGDIREKLLGLNAEGKPYRLSASGMQILCDVPTTGYRLTISFDYAEKVARYVETTGSAALTPGQEDDRAKQDVRERLAAEGWSIRE